MSLFDDDFYSSKVSRKTLREHFGVRKQSRRNGSFLSDWKVGKLSTLQIALISSFTSAIVVCLLFGVIFGFGSGSPSNREIAGLDPSQRAVQASDKVRPAVVSIINEQKFTLGLDSKAVDPESDESTVYKEAGVGSGVIIKKNDTHAYIITNFHVVNSAARVQAVLTTGEKREAEVVGLDQLTDLAVLKIDAKGIDDVAEIGDSSSLRAAEFVLAIGNPLGMGESITLGVVSVTNETIAVSLNQNGNLDWEQEVIRVDAAINQGNSGGPLIDLSGRVIGINSMKISNYGVESIGYAIPINNVMPIIDQLIEQGYVTRPFLGISMLDLQQYWAQQELDQEAEKDEEGTEGESQLSLPKGVYEGVFITEVQGPALKAELQHNDVIVQLDNTKVNSVRQLRKYLYEHKQVGDEIVIHYYRGKELVKTTAILGENKPN
ncbi:MAG: trypsin-like peptidase domain-containing protein [Candidatus Pristimantibacillus lignocellulolyticus]|uniref:Trypsin-like peptidase domain-containing protein n=1 Tax=Candidatus Pristimantibacillus lignocellulolyticus TaxID=2994561 RepID=A0A9J6ZIP8_9BACL|nr:MAG: trypsin-like peptidase domain-containing protein [Candidatus Pristimantibacillus lignocellulolyticus]